MQGSTFADRLRTVRKRNALSQVDLAKKARVDQATIARLEVSATAPRPSTIRKLAHALGVPPTVLTMDRPE
jgi:predicted transcriptional regulator